MRTQALINHRARRFAAVGVAIMLSAVGSAVAGPAGGGHGGGAGGHGGGGSFHGGGGGFHGGGHAGFGGHFRGNYYRGGGFRGGHYGGREYYRYHGGGYGRWRGWWGGVGLGVFLPMLPWDYETLWWGDVPFYYANNSYYLWDDDVGEYEAVEPPAELTPTPPASSLAASSDPTVSSDLFAYPKGGQSEEQQTRDKEECRRWAAEQTGFDPTQAQHDAASDAAARREGYLRAQVACLTARNYSVK